MKKPKIKRPASKGKYRTKDKSRRPAKTVSENITPLSPEEMAVDPNAGMLSAFDHNLHQCSTFVDAAADNEALAPHLPALRSLLGEDCHIEAPVASSGSFRNEMDGALTEELTRIAREHPLWDIGRLEITNSSFVTPASRPRIDVLGILGLVRKPIANAARNYIAGLVPTLPVKGGSGTQTDEYRYKVVAFVCGENIRATVERTCNTTGQFRLHANDEVTARVKWLETPRKRAKAVAKFWMMPTFDSSIVGASKDETMRAVLSESDWNTMLADDLRTLRLLSLMDLGKGLVTGGIGKEIKAALKRRERQFLKTKRGSTRIVHPDGVAHFWSELIGFLGGDAYAIPLVTYRFSDLRKYSPPKTLLPKGRRRPKAFGKRKKRKFLIY